MTSKHRRLFVKYHRSQYLERKGRKDCLVSQLWLSEGRPGLVTGWIGRKLKGIRHIKHNLLHLFSKKANYLMEMVILVHTLIEPS